VAGVWRKMTQELKMRKHVRRIMLVTAKVAIPLIVAGQLFRLFFRQLEAFSSGASESCSHIEFVGWNQLTVSPHFSSLLYM
jgi:hypothetical protein